MLEKSIQEQIEITVRKGEEAFNKSLILLKIVKKGCKIAVEASEEEANNFIDIDIELQKL